jgi:putative ABC transport system permease protein
VMRLLGYSRSHVLISYLLESVVIALIGGVLGMALGSLTHGWSATSIVSSGQGGGKTVIFSLEVSRLIYATGLILTLTMGILGGLIPSLSATRLKALDALR